MSRAQYYTSLNTWKSEKEAENETQNLNKNISSDQVLYLEKN